jgi:hypothetical protein
MVRPPSPVLAANESISNLYIYFDGASDETFSCCVVSGRLIVPTAGLEIRIIPMKIQLGSKQKRQPSTNWDWC